jgi:hypothetical protein
MILSNRFLVMNEFKQNGAPNIMSIGAVNHRLLRLLMPTKHHM